MKNDQDRDLVAIGYWFGWSDPRLPLPELFIGEPWIEEEKTAVIEHIKKGREKAMWMGFSRCRICKKIMGSKDFTDGVFVYPTRFEHYIEAHDLKPPKTFIDFALNRLDLEAFDEKLREIRKMPELEEFREYNIVFKDLTWWMFQERAYLSKGTPSARQEYLEEKERRIEEFKNW